MKPRLIFPFAEEKAIKTMPPNEEDVITSQFIYKVFPLSDKSKILKARTIPNYNGDYLK